MAEGSISIDEYSLYELERLRRKVDTVSGPGVIVNSPFELVIGGGASGKEASQQRGPITAKITEQLAGGGYYKARRVTPKAGTFTSDDDLVLSDQYEAGGNEYIIANKAEDRTNTHYLAVGELVDIFPSSQVVDGKPQYTTFVGITDIRFDTSTGTLDVAFTNSRTAGDWVQKIQFEPCSPGTGLTEGAG